MKLVDFRDRLTEADFQTMVVDRARWLGWRVHHDRGDYRSCIGGDPGFPDLVLAREGQVIFAELKSARGKITQQQTEWLTDLSGTTAHSGTTVSVHVWRPADWPQIEEALK